MSPEFRHMCNENVNATNGERYLDTTALLFMVCWRYLFVPMRGQSESSEGGAAQSDSLLKKWTMSMNLLQQPKAS